MKPKILKNYHYRESGLEYVYIDRVEVKSTEYGEAIESFPKDLHKKISIVILKSGRPLRGKEVVFLRKSLKMGQSELSKEIGIPNSTLVSWEKRFLNTELDRPVQAFLRANFLRLFGEKRADLDSILDSELNEENRMISMSA